MPYKHHKKKRNVIFLKKDKGRGEVLIDKNKYI